MGGKFLLCAWAAIFFLPEGRVSGLGQVGAAMGKPSLDSTAVLASWQQSIWCPNRGTLKIWATVCFWLVKDTKQSHTAKSTVENHLRSRGQHAAYKPLKSFKN